VFEEGSDRRLEKINEELRNLYTSPDILRVKMAVFRVVAPCSLVEVY
jgi:hypothetical protein